MFRMQGAVGRLGRCAWAQLSGVARPLALGAGLALALFLAGPVAAQNRAHPWIASPPRLQAEAYFTNLHDGDTVQSPFVVRFGLNLWGIAPAEHDIVRTGHHHLLIDKPLPIPPNRPIPFDDHHVHFGKGQMERVLDLPPGRHTLRLLLANHAHVPYFIYSPEITVTVKPGRSKLPADYGKQPRVEILGLSDNAVAKPPFRVNFHASGLNVASSAAKVKGTGHFQLLLHPTAPGGKDVALDFAGGETEAWLQPPAGSYRAQLVFVSNVGDASKPLATSGALNLRVGGDAP